MSNFFPFENQSFLDTDYGVLNENTTSDPAMQKLESSNQAGSAGKLTSYPLDIMNETNPGHFIMFQAYETSGISIEKVKRAVSDVINDGRGSGAGTLDEAPGENTFNNRITQSQRILNQDNSLESRLNTSEKTDLLYRQKKLLETIVLYMPENLTTSYGHEYSLESNIIGTGVRAALDAFSGAAARPGSRNPMQLVKDMMRGNRDYDNLIAGGAGAAAGGLAGAAAGAAKGGGLGAAVGGAAGGLGGGFGLVAAAGGIANSTTVSSLTRRVTNPYMEFLFKGVNQRTFQYSFNFAPRSEDEARAVFDIVKSFKLYSHPELDTENTSSALLRMPAEFDILFYSNLKENQTLNRVMPCALTNMEVNYTPDGTTSFFKDTGQNLGAMASKMTLTLTFSEVGLLDRRHIQANY